MGGSFKSFKIDKNPIRYAFSLEKIRDYWEKKAASGNGLEARMAQSLLEESAKFPELFSQALEMPVKRKHRQIFRSMLKFHFSDQQLDNDMIGISTPNEFKFFYASPKMEEVFGKNGKELAEDFFDYIKGEDYYGPVLHTYGMLLSKQYGVDTNFEVPSLTFKKKNKKTGLVRYYDIHVDQSNSDIIIEKDLPEFSGEEIQKMVNRFFDVHMLLKAIPPDHFLLKGFTIVRVTDSTQLRSAMELKDKLLEKDAIVSPKHFSKLEMRMRSLFNLSDLKMGFAVTDMENERIQENTSMASLLLDEDLVCKYQDVSIYQRAMQSQMPVIIHDLENRPGEDPLVKEFVKAGYKSLMLMPLFFDGKPVGMLELASPTVNGLNNLSMLNMQDILTPFSIAALRVSNELRNKIKAKIQEKFTAIHPVVEWKFERTAAQILRDEREQTNTDIEPILFRDVYPLYGAVDIRSSSQERNNAIVRDLVEQLTDAREILNKAWEMKKMPVFSQLNYQLNTYLDSLDQGLLSGDETRIIEFLRREVEPVFKHFRDALPELEKSIQRYEKKIDPQHGMLYKKRNDFEVSIGRINDAISSVIDVQEKSAQQMFPHYFEKYRTDGIEYNIYVGQSLLEKLSFDPVYLKNLRLWELIVMCQVARKTAGIKDELAIALDTTQLILVHSNPLDIRFREDEKKFDVEGGYNIRYEIIKKRIDKSLIKGTSERLTQPGSIAIIYSQAYEYYEYLKYIDYLQSIDYLEGKPESFELDDMQGVYGLQAMRVKVNLSREPKLNLDSMEKIVRQHIN